MNIDGYGNDFKLFYNTDLTTIKFIIIIIMVLFYLFIQYYAVLKEISIR